MPSFQGSQRRDARRRLAAAEQAGLDAAEPGFDTQTPHRGSQRKAGIYASKALPEQHASVATRIPVGTAPFIATLLGLLTVPSLLTGLAIAGPGVDTLERLAGVRWRQSLAFLHSLTDLRADSGFTAAVGLACFLIAAMLATVTKNVRRHRLDDRQGRHRRWGLMSVLFGIAAVAFVLPLHKIASVVMMDATGRSLGATGQGWWMLVVAAVWLPVGLWAVLPLTQRLGTAAFLGCSLAAWLAAGGIEEALVAGWQPPTWQLGSAETWALVAASLRVFTPTLATIGGLIACRSVIREARGLVPPRAARPTRQRRAKKRALSTATAAAMSAAAEVAEDAEPQSGDIAQQEQDAEPAEEPAEAAEESIDWEEATAPDQPSQLLENGDDLRTDSDEPRLSKAERRRLRKLARKNRAA